MRFPRFPAVLLAAALLLPLLGSASAAPASSARVFFLGNSYTLFWNLPGLFKDLANAGQPDVKVETAFFTRGGKNLEYYWKNWQEGATDDATIPPELGRLLGFGWDYYVLQSYGDDIPADLANYVPKFAEWIRSKNPRAKILLYFWAEKDGKTGIARLAPAFEKIARAQNVILVPVGYAWIKQREEQPDGWQAPDGWHPGYRRAYMTASALYATIFHASPVGLPVYSWSWKTYNLPDPKTQPDFTLAPDEARHLQQLAWDAVRQHSNDPAVRGR